MRSQIHPHPARPKPARPVMVWRQVLLGLLVFGYYLLVDALNSPERRRDADARGEALERFQRWLHIDVEYRLNDWLVGHDWLATIANYEYAFVYVLTALATLVYLLRWRMDLYRRARTAFLIVTLSAITCFWVFPTTPPRMLGHGLYVDTVTDGHTWGSWGSPLVKGANELAAMPSLHMAWALWVSVVLVWAGARRWVQLVSAVHVLITLVVILATANHYVLDAVAAFVLVTIAARIAVLTDPTARPGVLVPSADAFFLHVEGTPGRPGRAAQIVGGLVLWEYADGRPTLDQMRDLVAGELAGLPRFTQRLHDGGRWHRQRWVPAPGLDWDWHVIERRVAGRRGLEDEVAQLLRDPFPRDRPLWRVVLFDLGEGRRAMLFAVHHAFADGIGTVLQAMRLLRPRVELPEPPPRPGGLAVAAATAAG
ncbi:MAG: phosphatase PAP2 family protein, partial [Nocardioides sp.]|uniref:bifunctional phosphatase PAP2/O-acyltransferase family protein n=1 Tax=Nocardioides sp. TaxID=35761 RepID=UPI0039E61A9B